MAKPLRAVGGSGLSYRGPNRLSNSDRRALTGPGQAKAANSMDASSAGAVSIAIQHYAGVNLGLAAS